MNRHFSIPVAKKEGGQNDKRTSIAMLFGFIFGTRKWQQAHKGSIQGIWRWRFNLGFWIGFFFLVVIEEYPHFFFGCSCSNRENRGGVGEERGVGRRDQTTEGKDGSGRLIAPSVSTIFG